MSKTKLILVLVPMLLLCSCSKIFLNENTRYTPDRYTISDLQNKEYYAKDGSSFYKLYEPDKVGSVYVIGGDVETIPDLYSDEAIVLQTQDTKAKGMKLTRYTDEGFSLGIYDAIVNADGNIEFTEGKTVKGTSAYEISRKCPSPNFVIESINGRKCSEYEVSPGGTIRGFYENEVVSLSLYSGSSYVEVEMIADTHFLASYETLETDAPILTKLGYFAYMMPEEAKSGYYHINKGFFRYHDHVKGECASGGDNLNLPTYDTIEKELASRFIQYSVIVSAKNYDVKFDVSYDTASVEEEAVRCVMQSPEGEVYEMPAENGLASLTLAEIGAGKWIINLYPKGISGVNINVSSARVEDESLCVEYMFDVQNSIPSALFAASYTGKGQVWGTVENITTGESRVLVSSETKQTLSCDWEYLAAGTYRMRVYHYNDTTILSGTLSEKNDGYDTEIFIIE